MTKGLQQCITFEHP